MGLRMWRRSDRSVTPKTDRTDVRTDVRICATIPVLPGGTDGHQKQIVFIVTCVNDVDDGNQYDTVIEDDNTQDTVVETQVNTKSTLIRMTHNWEKKKFVRQRKS